MGAITLRRKTRKMKSNVITYQSPKGECINLTPKQVAEIKAGKRTWPKDSTGQEYCQVSRGLHWGFADEIYGEERHEK